MKKQEVPSPPTYKVETIEEFLARGGKIRKVDFSKAYEDNYHFGQSFKDYRIKPNQTIRIKYSPKTG